MKLFFVDIRKAYFNGVPSRRLYARLPPELGRPRETVARLDRCMYGTRDASQIWEACFTDALLEMRFVQGVASPCVFRHDGWGVHVVVHGDVFTALGNGTGLDV